MIEYVDGSVFNTNCDILAHGVNCQGGFGKGVAWQMGQLYPKAKQAYLAKFWNEGWKLGEIQFVESNGKIIANCATQDKYWQTGQKKEVLVKYWAIRSCMVKLLVYAQSRDLSVAIPKIGAGLAGGDWNKIERKINNEFRDYPIKVYVI